MVVAVPDNESPDGLCNTCVKEIYKQTPTVLAMDPASNGAHVSSKMDDERARHERRVRLKELNLSPRQQGRSLLLPSGNFSTLPTEFSRERNLFYTYIGFVKQNCSIYIVFVY